MIRQSAFVHASWLFVSFVVRIAVYLAGVTRRDASTGGSRGRAREYSKYVSKGAAIYS